MSVINKMLRDLDHRQAPESGAARGRPGQGLHRDTLSIAPAPVPASRARALQRLGAGVLVVALFAVVGWVWQQASREKPRPQTLGAPVFQVPPPAAVTVQAPPAASTSAPQNAPSVEVAPAQTSNAVQPAPRPVSGAVVLRMDSTLSRRGGRESERLASPAVAKVETPAERPQPPTPPAAAVAPATARALPPDAAQLAQRQQQASKDAVAHAQSLWNAGSREAAIEWMEEVLATAERTAVAGATPAATQLLLISVRELARMQLAQSQPQAVWDLLTRLEPLLENQADLWAVRAHAAQRLGRHQDSVHAYMAALQVRPNEQRWLLGAAVSLAALGQTSGAAEMAEKARVVGVVSKEVLAYLRQMGVPVKD